MADDQRRLRQLEWHARFRASHGATADLRCVQCGRAFMGRLFDPPVQLPLAGWRDAGVGWACPTCMNRRAPEPRAVAVCFECDATFGVAHVPEAEIEQKGWRKLGDAWVCARCAVAIASEDD